jgi:hypothetical protein
LTTGIAAINKHIFYLGQIVLVQGKSLQRPGAIGHIGGRDMNGVRQSIGVYSDVAFNARDQFASIKPLVFRRVRVLDALRVNNQKSCLFVPTKASSNLANHLFLRLPPRGCATRVLFSTWRSRHSNSPIWESLREACATDIRFSAHIGSRKTPHKDQAFGALSSFAPFPKQVVLSPQTLLG